MRASSFLAAPQPLYVGGKKYEAYGFFNESTNRSRFVCYKVSIGNIIWAILLIETVFAPIYFVGFDLWNPERPKKNSQDDCSIDYVDPRTKIDGGVKI